MTMTSWQEVRNCPAGERLSEASLAGKAVTGEWLYVNSAACSMTGMMSRPGQEGDA